MEFLADYRLPIMAVLAQIMGTKKTLVVGLGNPILGDDGVGWRVAQAVKAKRPSLAVICLSLGGLSLMEQLIGFERVILIDSIQTGSGLAGDIYTINLTDLPDYSTGHTTAVHDTSLQTALNLGRRMGADLPDDIQVVAIEADRVYDFSDELTPVVAEAVPRAVTAVLELL